MTEDQRHATIKDIMHHLQGIDNPYHYQLLAIDDLTRRNNREKAMKKQILPMLQVSDIYQNTTDTRRQ